MNKTVYVVNKITPGWNSVVAVFYGVSYETLERRFPMPEYSIEEFDVDKNLNNWPQENDDE
jgi:hypothetical protein